MANQAENPTTPTTPQITVTNVAVNFLNRGYNMVTLSSGTNCITTDNNTVIGSVINPSEVVTPQTGAPTYRFNGSIVAQNKQVAAKNIVNTYASAILEHQNPESAAKALMLLKEMGL